MGTRTIGITAMGENRFSVSTHAANHHEVRLVQLCFDFYMIEAKPENLIGDRAYDSDPLDVRDGDLRDRRSRVNVANLSP